MPLVARRKLRQTWREAVVARAGAAGDAVFRFDDLLRDGRDDGEAAYQALASAGLLWLVDEPGTPSPSTGSDEVPAV